MEVSIGLLIVVVAIIGVAMYYGVGQNVEVASRMLTRELVDAERIQKERIVRKYSVKDTIKKADFDTAVKHITAIDELDI